MSDNDNTPVLKDPLENFLGYQLRRAAFTTLSALVDSFADLGVSNTEGVIIRFVHTNSGCTQADIGRAIGVKRTNMVPIINGLMVKGLLERAPADGRSHSLYLTEAGGELHRRIVRVHLEHEKYFFGDLPEETRRMLMESFRSLRAKGDLRG
jgi:DNA-binding MarR family transcriptional regulator